MLNKSFVGRWVSFDQYDGWGHYEGHVDKAFVVSESQVYLNTKDNPRCRPGTGEFIKSKCPEGLNYGWSMYRNSSGRSSFENLRLSDDIGEL